MLISKHLILTVMKDTCQAATWQKNHQQICKYTSKNAFSPFQYNIIRTLAKVISWTIAPGTARPAWQLAVFSAWRGLKDVETKNKNKKPTSKCGQGTSLNTRIQILELPKYMAEILLNNQRKHEDIIGRGRFRYMGCQYIYPMPIMP